MTPIEIMARVMEDGVPVPAVTSEKTREAQDRYIRSQTAVNQYAAQQNARAAVKALEEAGFAIVSIENPSDEMLESYSHALTDCILTGKVLGGRRAWKTFMKAAKAKP